jgi:hypothetical protein
VRNSVIVTSYLERDNSEDVRDEAEVRVREHGQGDRVGDDLRDHRRLLAAVDAGDEAGLLAASDAPVGSVEVRV